MSASAEVIEGVYRVVATSDAPRRQSPNRRRAVLRVAFWHSALLIALVATPLVL
ncbi:MAG: hypothetical protein JNK30_07210 [Phenylobacterium sp.]|uniref:hypothetical protein n=1 Tax=Phenylobacterium sp. TaxID=1871053 RepID=UPI001A389A58|nr:hypothetical protein [Phenylobacterium sp.]MBL8771157.1 hypothetical protein [Phenylobacterium sp.]